MDAYDDEWEDSDFETDAESSEAALNFKPSYLLIAIDTDKSMFEDVEKNTYPFIAAISACHNIANSLVVSSENSVKGPLGIVLADNNTAKSNLIEFEQTVPETIKLLKSLQDQSKQELQSKYERQQNFDLGDFFLACKNKLLNIKNEVYKRIIIYITNDDNPHQGDFKKKFKILNESQKFLSIQMELIVVTFNVNFDYSNLYSEVLEAAKSPLIETVSSDTLTQKLKTFINRKHTLRRINFYPFPGNLLSYFETVLTKPTTTKKTLKNMHVTRSTQKEVKKTFKQNKADTFECIYSRNRDPIALNVAERQNFGETALPLGYTLAYVSEPILKPGWVIAAPYLMEKSSKENSQLFEIFWQFCRDKKKCLVCYQKLKKGSNVRFVELIPKFLNDSRQFLIKAIPYASEIYYNPVPTPALYDFSGQEKEAMESMVDALTINYKVNVFRDPVESKKQAYIKSQLLEEDMETIADGVDSDEVIDERLATVLEKLNGCDLQEKVQKKKRLWPDSLKKRKKAE